MSVARFETESLPVFSKNSVHKFGVNLTRLTNGRMIHIRQAPRGPAPPFLLPLSMQVPMRPFEFTTALALGEDRRGFSYGGNELGAPSCPPISIPSSLQDDALWTASSRHT